MPRDLLSSRNARFYPVRMLDLSGIDLDEIATALADQTDYEHRWLIDPRTGEVAFWKMNGASTAREPFSAESAVSFIR